MPIQRSRKARIAFASIRLLPGRQQDRLVSDRAALLASLVPGTGVERFGREWRMAKFDRTEEYLTGRIGFMAPGSTEELWNEKEQDFEPRRLVVGTTSPFAIKIESEGGPFPIAFQLRGNRIKVQTFTGNFQALLHQASGNLRWSVDPIIRGEPWGEWAARVDRVVALSVKIERPNPHYSRESVEQLVEGMKAQAMRLSAEAEDGLDITDAFIQDLLDHADAYGSYTATGEIGSGQKPERDVYKSEQEGSAAKVELPTNPDTREVRVEDLKDALEDELDEDNG